MFSLPKKKEKITVNSWLAGLPRLVYQFKIEPEIGAKSGISRLEWSTVNPNGLEQRLWNDAEVSQK